MGSPDAASLQVKISVGFRKGIPGRMRLGGSCIGSRGKIGPEFVTRLEII